MSKYTPDVITRFESKICRTETCWIWQANTSPKGYGLFQLATRKGVQAHRLSYEIHVGPVPKGMVLDHTCHNPACVNPEHLRPVTNKQNGENRKGPNKNNTSGFRGVIWDKEASKWRTRVGHNGRDYGTRHSQLEDAIAEAIHLRQLLFTHSDTDRIAS